MVIDSGLLLSVLRKIGLGGRKNADSEFLISLLILVLILLHRRPSLFQRRLKTTSPIYLGDLHLLVSVVVIKTSGSALLESL